LNFLHANIRAPRNLSISVNVLDPSYIKFEREEASEYLQNMLFVACSRRKCYYQKTKIIFMKKFGMSLQVVTAVNSIRRSWTHCNWKHLCQQLV